MEFQISALNIDQFSHLFGQDSETLSKQGVQRIIVDSNPGFPCRVSLQDAEVGENVLLMNYEHQPLPTPFRSSHAIYVREGANQAKPEKNQVPKMFRHRLLSVRAFDECGIRVLLECRFSFNPDSVVQQASSDFVRPGSLGALGRNAPSPRDTGTSNRPAGRTGLHELAQERRSQQRPRAAQA